MENLTATNALLSYVTQVSGGSADTNKLNTLLHALSTSLAAPLQAELETTKSDLNECIAGHKQAWGICDAVAAELGDDLDRDAGSAASIKQLKQRLAQLEQENQTLKDSKRSFKVHVAKMTESHQVTYMVTLENDRPAPDATEHGENARMVPYTTPIKENAELDAQEWAEFLGVNYTGNTN